MRSITIVLAATACLLAGCDPEAPGKNVNVSADGDGVKGSAKVVDTKTTDVKVGTGGASATVKPGDGPFKVRIGKNGVRVGI